MYMYMYTCICTHVVIVKRRRREGARKNKEGGILMTHIPKPFSDKDDVLHDRILIKLGLNPFMTIPPPYLLTSLSWKLSRESELLTAPISFPLTVRTI